MSDNKCVDMNFIDEEIKNDKVYFRIGVKSKFITAFGQESPSVFYNFDLDWPSFQSYIVSLPHEIYCFGGILGGVVFSSFNGFSWSKVIFLVKYDDDCRVMGCEVMDGKVYLIFYRVQSKKLCCITYSKYSDLQEEIIIANDVSMRLTAYAADTILYNGAIYIFYLKNNNRIFFRWSRDDFAIEYSIREDGSQEESMVGDMLSVCKVEGVPGFHLLLLDQLYYFSRKGVERIKNMPSHGRLSSGGAHKLSLLTENKITSYEVSDAGKLIEGDESPSAVEFGMFGCLMV